MNRIFSTFAVIILLTVASSATVDNTTGTELGMTAPEITMANKNTSLTLNSLRGQYVLISFWKTSDAESRQLCMQYSRMDDNGALANANIRFIGINLDKSSPLFYAVAKADGLDINNQFSPDADTAADIIDAYHLSGGALGALLIDPQGKIVAINPGKDTIASLSNPQQA